MRPKLIYISGPLTSDPFTPRTDASGPSAGPLLVERHRLVALEEAEFIRAAGAMPITPHVLSLHISHAASEEDWLAGDIEIMLRCDAVVFISGWGRSFGAMKEHDVAIANNMVVFEGCYRRSQLEKWLRISRQLIGAGLTDGVTGLPIDDNSRADWLP